MQVQNNFKNNTDVLTSFFSKPLTLITAISLSAGVVIQFLCGILSGAGMNVDVFSVCLAIGFFLLYFRAKNRNALTNYNAPLTLIKVISIITAVLNGLVLALTVFLLFLSFLLSVEVPEIAAILTELSLYGSILLLVYLLYTIGFAVFASSMKKTSLTIDIKKKGSLLTAVSGIFSIVAIIVCTVMFISSFESIITTFINMIGEALSYEESFDSIYMEELFTVNVIDFIPLIIQSVVGCINVIITCVYAFYYYIYMKQVEKNYTPELATHTTPYHNLYGNQQKTSIDFKKAAAIDPMYAAAAMSTLPKDRINCPSCGSVVEINLKFCPMCGQKLENKQ